MAAAQRIPVVGLTGGIAAGKSEALAALDRLGAATLSADAVVHELLGTDAVRDALVERWGGDVAPGGAVDRERVATIVFRSPEELGWLERTLHPLVGERIVAWRAGLGDGPPVAVVEVPLLFESGMEDAFERSAPGCGARSSSTAARRASSPRRRRPAARRTPSPTTPGSKSSSASSSG